MGQYGREIGARTLYKDFGTTLLLELYTYYSSKIESATESATESSDESAETSHS